MFPQNSNSFSKTSLFPADASQDLIPNKEVLGTKSQVVTGFFYKIRSKQKTVLDDWGGATGVDAAAYQPDDTPNHPNRMWHFVPTTDKG